MGFISTVVIYNDTLHELAKDPTVGARVSSAILGLYDGKPKDIGHYGQAVETHHNSGLIAILVGNSTGVPVRAYIPETAPDPELQLLRSLAERHGFHLRKKPKR